MQNAFEHTILTRSSAGEEVHYDDASGILEELVYVWNKDLDSIKVQIQDSLSHSGMDAPLMLEEFKKVYLCKSPQARWKAVWRLCRRVGIKPSSNTKPAKHHGDGHPEMAAVRMWVATSRETHGIHPRMICNFDQVWTTLFEHRKKVLFKDPGTKGSRPNRQKPTIKKMVDAILRSLNVDKDPGPDLDDEPYKALPPALNAQGRISAVEAWRLPRTTTTLSWSDGDVGPAFITIKHGDISQENLIKLKGDFQGVAFIYIRKPLRVPPQ